MAKGCEKAQPPRHWASAFCSHEASPGTLDRTELIPTHSTPTSCSRCGTISQRYHNDGIFFLNRDLFLMTPQAHSLMGGVVFWVHVALEMGPHLGPQC